MKTIIEPFRIKSVEPLRLTTPDERKAYLAAAHYNGWLKHIPPLQYPGQALACALYEVGGIRACEIGTVMFGRQRDGSEKPAAMDLVRLAMPRRVYTQSHADYIVETFAEIAVAPERLKGYRIVSEPPALRHFTAKFEPLPG